jgi:hypothetical protein
MLLYYFLDMAAGSLARHGPYPLLQGCFLDLASGSLARHGPGPLLQGCERITFLCVFWT